MKCPFCQEEIRYSLHATEESAVSFHVMLDHLPSDNRCWCGESFVGYWRHHFVVEVGIANLPAHAAEHAHLWLGKVLGVNE